MTGGSRPTGHLGLRCLNFRILALPNLKIPARSGAEAGVQLCPIARPSTVNVLTSGGGKAWSLATVRVGQVCSPSL